MPELKFCDFGGLSALRSADKVAYEFVLTELQTYSTAIARRNELFLEGLSLKHKHKLDDAETKFLEAWNISKMNPSINRELASLYCKEGRYSDAESHARSIYKGAPTNPFIIDILAETLLGKKQNGLPVDEGELQQILQELKEYGDAPGSSFWLTREAQHLTRERKHSDALRMIDRAVDRTPNLLAARFIRAGICIALKDIGASKRELETINKLLNDAAGFSEGDEARFHELEVIVLMEERNFKDAKRKIDTSYFLSDKMKGRLLNRLAKAISFDPKGADAALAAWAKSYPTKR